MRQPTGRRSETVWCQDNNLSFNVSKTREMIVDYRRKRGKHTHTDIYGVVEKRVKSMKFLAVHLHSRGEGMTLTFHPQEVENICHGPSDPQKVLQLHH
jgi:hypothetical protein